MSQSIIDIMLAELKGLGTDLALRVVKEGLDLLSKAGRGEELTREDRAAWHERVHEAYAEQGGKKE